MHKNFEERDSRMKDMAGGKMLKVAAVKEEEPKRKRERTPKRSGGDNHSEVNDIPPLLAAKRGKRRQGVQRSPRQLRAGL